MTTNPADTLRAAADKLRALANGATYEDRTTWAPGHTKGSLSAVVLDHPERPGVLIETWASHLEDVNQYIATMGPALGLALADWLASAAEDAEQIGANHHALAVACQILGTDQ
ncbi:MULTISPECIES: hypothetical protein [unclassified Streptomyces]|uniref:hypothetical protein n=1 Tax=unclassified Streptomyces TaxID=2593676 RepID=UPI000882B81F|nr:MULTISPECIES: hypothetical protein [unclassified Streptomyces]PBC72324.1 hypothetical protein BX261_7408 [Streptomyces sp. 2321.6]SDR62165.1 hypothetical protein SAMN05216511_7295 [Streptomyces sp. KS_16]SEE50756.1 hypothetical protein SAMN05428940_7344 [Streptomyces sp. 2133.1]SNC77828.1 hypothetical protein SAMN06272741_7244 [Streptomyces sp. 2114.4]